MIILHNFKANEIIMKMEIKTLEDKIIHLYYIHQYSIRQVVRELKCSDQTVRNALLNSGGIRSTQKALALRSTDEYREKIRLTKIGERNTQSKLTEEKVIAIRAAYTELLGSFSKTQAQHLLADEHGVKRPTISDVVLRKTWKHI